MRPWRPKRAKQKPAAGASPSGSSGDFLAPGPASAPARRRAEPKRMRIYMTHLAALPVVAGVAVVAGITTLTSAPGAPLSVREPAPAGRRAPHGRSGTSRVELLRPDAPEGAAAPTDAPQALARALRDTSRPWDERLAAALALAEAGGDGALDALLAATLSPHDSTRRIAAVGLTRHLGDDRVEDALYRLIGDPVPTVAAAVARELGRHPGGRPFLLHRLRGREAPGAVHLACLQGLGATGTLQDLPALLPWTEEEGDVGMTATFSVRAICERHEVEPPDGVGDGAVGGPGPRHR